RHFFDEYVGAFIRFTTRETAAGCEREYDVVLDGLPWQQLIEFLEHEHPVRTGPLNCFAIQTDAAFDRFDVASGSFQDRGFPTSGWPENDETIRTLDAEADVAGGCECLFAVAVFERDILDGEET